MATVLLSDDVNIYEVDPNGVVQEDTTFSDSGDIMYNDILPLINNPTPTVTLQSGPAGLGTFGAENTSELLSAVTGLGRKITWTYNINNTAAQSLAVGQTVDVVYRVTINDNVGNVAFADITISVVGTNDGVTFVSANNLAVFESDTPDVTNGALVFDDVDLTDTHTASFVPSASNTTALGTFALGAITEDALTSGGSLAYSYTVNPAATQSLNQGQVVSEIYTVTVRDVTGATLSRDISVTITGTNDVPVVTAGPVYTASAVGFTVTDVDAGATLTVSGPGLLAPLAITSGTPVNLAVAAQAAVAEGQLSVSDGIAPPVNIGFLSLGTNGGDTLSLLSAGAAYGFDGDDTITGSAGNDAIFGGEGNDTVNYALGSSGADQMDLGNGADRVNVSAGGAPQVRVTFVSAEVGNGSPLNATAPGAGLAYAGEGAGGLAVRLQAEDALDGLISDVGRADDEGITFVAAPGTTFDVRDLVSGAARGDQFNFVVLGTSGADLSDFSAFGANYYVNAGAGNDTVIGGTGNDFLVGNGGFDLLVGGDGNDSFIGGGGNDSIIGGLGADVLTGGAGIDTFFFSTGESSSTALFDTVTDFEPGLDKFDLGSKFIYAGNVDLPDEAGLLAILDAFNAALLPIPVGALYTARAADTGSAYFYYDANGNGLFDLTNGDLLVEVANAAAALTEDDFITTIGTADNDDIFGGPGGDTLIGLAGFDSFIFEAGDSGSLTVFDTITDYQQGTDRILIDGSFTLVDTAVFDSEAALTAAIGSFTGVAFPVQNALYTYQTTAGDAYFFYDANGNALHDLAGGDVFVKLDGLAAGLTASDFYTNSVGGAGNDTVAGTLGSDQLFGNGGADVFNFRAGDSGTKYGIDSIRDFTQGVDRIDIPDGFTLVVGPDLMTLADSLSIVGGLEGVAVPAGILFTYQMTAEGNSGFYYDANQNGVIDLTADGGDLLVLVSGVNALNLSDFI